MVIIVLVHRSEAGLLHAAVLKRSEAAPTSRRLAARPMPWRLAINTRATEPTGGSAPWGAGSCVIPRYASLCSCIDIFSATATAVSP